MRMKATVVALAVVLCAALPLCAEDQVNAKPESANSGIADAPEATPDGLIITGEPAYPRTCITLLDAEWNPYLDPCMCNTIVLWMVDYLYLQHQNECAQYYDSSLTVIAWGHVNPLFTCPPWNDCQQYPLLDTTVWLKSRCCYRSGIADS